MSDDLTRISLETGERVRIDIPDESDPDHRHHGTNGEIISIFSDEAGSVTGNPQDDNLYRVKLDSGEVVDVRARDLRPPI